MIKANELRIDNLVNRLGKTTKINAIQINTEGHGYLSTERTGAITENQVEPIPLTEEWLLKFGIYIDCQSITLKSGTIGSTQKGSNGSFKYVLQSAFGMVHLDSIKYVHSLQNLYFALTGSELEIK